MTWSFPQSPLLLTLSHESGGFGGASVKAERQGEGQQLLDKPGKTKSKQSTRGRGDSERKRFNSE